MTDAAEGALFVEEGDRWLPTDYARGPWSPDALHGGPVAALVAREAERCPSEHDTRIVRLSLELLRPVPVTALDVESRISRPGRKVQLVDVRVSSDGVDLAWGRALRIRAQDPEGDVARELDSALRRDEEQPPGPESGHSTPPVVQGYVGFHNTGAEMRFVRGEFGSRGGATVWVRLAVPVVAGEDPSPFQRVAAAADFGNGISSVLDYQRWTFINPDLTVYVQRPPVGEWVCLDAVTRLGTPGIGVAESALWDVGGRIGRSVQGLLVEPR